MNPVDNTKNVFQKHNILEEIPNALIFTLCACGMLMLCVYVHIALILPFTLIIALLCISSNGAPAGIRIFLSFVIFQNLVISALSPTIISKQVFTTLQGGNFVLTMFTAVMAGILLLMNYPKLKHVEKRIVKYVVALLFLALFYFALGMAKGAGFTGAVTYVRSFITPILMLIIGIYWGKIGHRDTVLKYFIIIGAIATVQGIIELVIPIPFYTLISVDTFMNIKQEGINGFSNAEAVLEHYTQSLFNTPIFRDSGLVSRRLFGPNMHGISFAYILVITCFAAFYYKKTIVLFLALPSLFIIGAKGPIILLVLTLSGYFILFAFRSKNFTKVNIYLLGTLYAVGGVIYGYITRDYHVIGFLGGVRSFLSNPIGQGLGMGGNLSSLHTEVDWGEAQRNGLDYGTESAIGVLLYQVGIATFIFLYLYMFIVQHFFKQSPENGYQVRFYALPIALLFLMINGIFQEEAYSPYALGLLSLIVGVVIATPYDRYVKKPIS
ncbi:MAG: hypothetical protein ACJARD_000728 [Alphaproteobacteria bacterium]|jgi:hypothetical protein